uniref:Alanyl-tRNA synthetase n=1 Tax=Streptomyces miharaensis TaxID=285483 RepID=A0A7S5HWM1_9ACTN|nr:alanyl-tRNA synthetase [Streptomyces miharaensis]
MTEGLAQSRAQPCGAEAAPLFVESLMRAGYRRRPPRPLLAGGGATTLLTSVAAPDWRWSLSGYPRPEAGGAVVLQWIVNTSRVTALPPASPPSAGRVVGAVWTGARPYTAALQDVFEALRDSGAGTGGLTFLLSAQPEDRNAVVRALRALGVERDRVVDGGGVAGVPPRMAPELGPRLTVRRRSDSAMYAHCGPGCPCGCHLSVAHLQFAERRRRAGRLTALPHPLFEMIVPENVLTHRGAGPEPGVAAAGVPPLLGPLTASISAVLAEAADPAGVSSVFLADLSSAAALLLGEGVAPGPRGGPYVLRRLIRMIGSELAVRGVPPSMLREVIAVADVAYRVPLGLTPLSPGSWEHVARESRAFERVVRRGRARVLGPGLLSGSPRETARALARLRSEQGVPLGLSLRWCREEGVELPPAVMALEELNGRGMRDRN